MIAPAAAPTTPPASAAPAVRPAKPPISAPVPPPISAPPSTRSCRGFAQPASARATATTISVLRIPCPLRVGVTRRRSRPISSTASISLSAGITNRQRLQLCPDRACVHGRHRQEQRLGHACWMLYIQGDECDEVRRVLCVDEREVTIVEHEPAV